MQSDSDKKAKGGEKVGKADDEKASMSVSEGEVVGRAG